ncbi:hypothetical protein GCK32_012879, partial [Trichostrongylus colubriformis]
ICLCQQAAMKSTENGICVKTIKKQFSKGKLRFEILLCYGSWRRVVQQLRVEAGAAQPLSELKVAKAAESYRAQEKEVKHHSSELDNIEQIQLKNSDPLPNRNFVGVDAEEMCETGRAECIQPFAKIRPLIVVWVGDPCFGCGHNMTCFLEQEYKRRCDMDTYYDKYHFIRYSNDPKDTLLEDLTLLLRSQNKNMSTLMLNIICYLWRERDFVKMGRKILEESWESSFCKNKNFFNGIDTMLQNLEVRNLSEWSLMMVTREPTDRFLSGFIDRCLRRGLKCYGCGSNMTCFLEQTYFRARMYAMRTLSTDYDLISPKTTVVDRHIFPQNWRCDMQKYGKMYNFIRYSSNPDSELLRDLISVLRRQKVRYVCGSSLFPRGSGWGRGSKCIILELDTREPAKPLELWIFFNL